ncbi:bifunctional folylpolyglutamate synthase/dihydrofolate synthase [Sphingobacterium griseoflavum]|uniref:Dihydrofolate synthase/folylpolyglutamate synthase n=1 Tax=Sphingobacterium griseoflavum TaxID=1474952 RepID=A0ABQ3I125_9SPHI|nr:folylpolyglutamate synthase/dihydrofolate synthase family protein [Sphingobacterium griseoflavum]GHE43785.1 folylpolyglutamate synthase [Sphingobacterium griseoflavum]
MINTYDEVIAYLYARLPMFTRDGASAIKKDVNNIIRLCAALDNPHQKFKSVHVAGTNGKGSTSHMLASILASAGYKTGLYTSPHLVDFRERIRVNGEMIPKAEVIAFVNDYVQTIDQIKPSFFEVTVAMAFDYFAKQQVDIAIIEVGLGGRLDSTNIIHPELCIITNIGMDHMDLLGDTLPKIAAEKAGIMKASVPVIIAERDEQVAPVFERHAALVGAPLRFATADMQALDVTRDASGLHINVLQVQAGKKQLWDLQLTGFYQQKNLLGVLAAVDELKKQGWRIQDAQIREGLSHVQEYTGLQGRWQTLSVDPFIICDTGHNEDGIREVVRNLQQTDYGRLHMVIGAMRDKDLKHMLPLLPTEAQYYFSSPAMPRALPAKELRDAAKHWKLRGEAFVTVVDALQAAKENFQKGDLIFVGGSTFVVAEVLQANGFA